MSLLTGRADSKGVSDEILIAWRFYVGAGHQWREPYVSHGRALVFRALVLGFSVDDRWAIIKGVPELACNEWSRFRLGCLETRVHVHVPSGGSYGTWQNISTRYENGFPVGGVIASVGGLQKAEREHWCGMRGRPRDDELRWIRAQLDNMEAGSTIGTTMRHERWLSGFHPRGGAHYWKWADRHEEPRAVWVAMLERWEPQRMAERRMWRGLRERAFEVRPWQRVSGVGAKPPPEETFSRLSRLLNSARLKAATKKVAEGFQELGRAVRAMPAIDMAVEGGSIYGKPFVIEAPKPPPQLEDHRKAGGARGWPGRGMGHKGRR